MWESRIYNSLYARCHAFGTKLQHILPPLCVNARKCGVPYESKTKLGQAHIQAHTHCHADIWYASNLRTTLCTNQSARCRVVAIKLSYITRREILCQFLAIIPLKYIHRNALLWFLKPRNQFSVFYIRGQVKVSIISCGSAPASNKPFWLEVEARID